MRGDSTIFKGDTFVEVRRRARLASACRVRVQRELTSGCRSRCLTVFIAERS